WIARAGHAAAYRERWNIPDSVTELLPIASRGEQGRARAWVAERLNQPPAPTRPTRSNPRATTPVVERAARIRNRIAALANRLERPEHHTTQPPPQPDREHDREP